MARVTFTQEDILRSKLITPGWQDLLVKKYSEEQAGTDGSALYVWEIVVEGGAFNGVPIRYQLSEKAMGMGVEFLEACGIEIKPGVAIELDKTLGKKISGFVQRGEYKGKGNNQLVSFKKRKEVSQG